MSSINVQSGLSPATQSGIASLIPPASWAAESASARPAQARGEARPQGQAENQDQPRQAPAEHEAPPPAAENDPAQPTAARPAKSTASKPAAKKQQPNFLELMSQFLAVSPVSAAAPVEAPAGVKPQAGANSQTAQAVGDQGQGATVLEAQAGPAGEQASSPAASAGSSLEFSQTALAGTLQAPPDQNALTGTLRTQPGPSPVPASGGWLETAPTGVQTPSNQNAVAGGLQTQAVALVVPPPRSDAELGVQTPSNQNTLTGAPRTESAASAVSPGGPSTNGDGLTGTLQTHPGGAVAGSFPRPWSLTTAAKDAAVPPADALAQAVRGGSAQSAQSATEPSRKAAGLSLGDAAGLQAVQAAQASSTPAAAAIADGPVTLADPAPSARSHLSDQISASLSSANVRPGQEILIRLDPPSLGEVRIRLSSDNGQVIGHLEVSRPDTLRQLEQEAPGLIQRLADQGIQMRKLDLGLSDNGFSQNSGGRHHDDGGSLLNQQGFAHQEQQGWQDRWEQADGRAARVSGASSEEALAGARRAGAGAPGQVRDTSLNFWV